jgi:anti-anti-sigma factor
MELIINKTDNEVVARLVGRLDTPASQDIAADVQSLIEEAGKTIVLDCKEMSYISSSGLRIFLTLRKAAADKGGHIIVRDINDDIRGVFMMTGFLNLFEIQ